jgi:hypothetical protein
MHGQQNIEGCVYSYRCSSKEVWANRWEEGVRVDEQALEDNGPPSGGL